MSYYTKFLFTLIFCVSFLSSASLLAQNSFFELRGRAASITEIKAGNQTIELWGLEKMDSIPTILRLEGRELLSSMIDNAALKCQRISQSHNNIRAQCANQSDLDLGVALIQNGFATADRAEIFGTLFEDPYIEAEQLAQKNQLGLWKSKDQSSVFKENMLLIIAGLNSAILLFLIFAFFIQKRALDILQENQIDAMQHIVQKSDLKTQEKTLTTTMIKAEIEANKSKIEAYLTIYEEMLAGLKDESMTPKYQKSGDMVQLQPGLERAVFDANTDKLGLLSSELTRDIVHLYAQVQTTPDYKNLEPNTPLEEATKIIETSVINSKKLMAEIDVVLDQL